VASKTEKREKREAVSYQDRIIEALLESENFTAPQEKLLIGVTGKRDHLLDAILQLEEHGVVLASGTPHSPTNPLKLMLIPQALQMHDMGNGRLQPRITTGAYEVRREMSQVPTVHEEIDGKYNSTLHEQTSTAEQQNSRMAA
jgi:hypothetical protein